VRGVEDNEKEGEFEMRRTVLVVVFLSAVLVPTLIGMGVDLGVKFGVQSPSLAIQAEWDVSPELTMGMFVETSLEPIFNPAATQTLSLTIGLVAKYRFTHIHPAFVPYLGVAGSFGLSGTETTIALDALAGARVYITRNVSLFAEAAFFIVPFPDLAAWYDLTSLYRTLYLGFSLRL